MRHRKPVWICGVSNTQGKSACSAKAVPESVLDELEDKYAVKKFVLCDGNKIELVLESGETITETWFDRSRSESWTAEKRKEQSERMKKIWSEK